MPISATPQSDENQIAAEQLSVVIEARPLMQIMPESEVIELGERLMQVYGIRQICDLTITDDGVVIR